MNFYMNENIIKYLSCPSCKNNIEIKKIECKEDEEVINGTLICNGCECEFPIINGLPNLINNLSNEVKKIQKVYSKEWDLFDYNDKLQH